MPLPAKMRCIEIAEFGGPEMLRVAERAVPVPGPAEVLIQVEAAGINRPDVSQRKGQYPPPAGASDIPGLEVAGTVVQLGEGVTWPPIGETVCALMTGGGYAEFAVANAALCLPVPSGFTSVQAGALPETFFTVWHNVFQRGGLKAGESFLVHGGTSGIGTTAIQLAKAFGANVFATARGTAKGDACRKLGCDRAIDYSTEDFVAVIAAETGGKGVDLILDMVGGDYVNRNLASLANDGRHVSIAFLGGSKTQLNLPPIMMKRLTLTGSTLRPRPVAIKAAIAAELREQVWPLLSAGRISPVIYATLRLEQASEGHILMEGSEHIGKIMFTL